MTNKQVKCKTRVADHGEVFTHEREVNAMLDLVKQETERIDSRFLEPACGTGNFLAEVLNRKLNEVENRYKKNQLDFERYAIIALSSIYGIDILEDNVFDFAPDRALRQIAEYSTRLSTNESNPEKQVAEFIEFLPVLAYDGSSMKQIDAAGILDMAMSGTTATLLARRWESALLVNVDNNTLAKLLSNPDALNALMSIEGFRSLNQDIETIINKSESVKKTKKEANERDLTPKEKKELSDEEKEYKSKRKVIQEKLIKFATRIPVFMYLTDYRERSLKDVITQLEPALFKKVTGLYVKDFELLVSLGVFNSALMNDAVYKFKRYEDASLEYIGINKHEGEDVGLWDTSISSEDYQEIFVNS